METFDFKTALFKMKFERKKVRVRGWKGYWFWDNKTNKITIHDQHGKEYTEANDIELTCISAISKEWEEVL